MSYTTPPITSATSYGAIESYSAIQSAPALLTRFTPSPQCSTNWYWDTAALRSSSVAFSDAAHDPQWNTCQPYNATGATYSAGVCPEKSEFKSVTQVSWDGVSEPYYLGACCASTASLQGYQSGDVSLTGCVATVTSTSVVATWIQEDSTPTAVTSKGPITVIANPLYMVWHEEDTSLHPESDANSLRAAMGMTLPSSTTSTTPVITVTATPVSNESLAPGAIAGIAVAFAVCLIALVVLGYFAFIRRKRTRTTAPEQGGLDDNPENSNTWSSREVAGGTLQLETPNTSDKTHPFMEFYRAESAHSRTPQTPHTPEMQSQSKDEGLFAVEQKMLIR